MGLFPLDERLALQAGTHFSPWLVESMVLLGARMPFAQVPALLAHFTGVTVGRETVRRVTEAAGAAGVALATNEVAVLHRSRSRPLTGPALQQLSVDGAMVSLVGGTWAEVKTLALGTVMTGADGTPAATDMSYFSRLTDAETFGDLATAETHRRGTITARTVVAVTDGAAWCQGFIDLQRPDAVRILDFPHALEHLGAVAQAVLGIGTEATSAWIGEQAHALRHGQEAQVLAALTTLGERPGLSEAAATAVRQTRGYFVTREAAIHYDAFVAAGYPIGSGCVESANKVVVEARLKGAGMHWARANVNSLLELRTVLANDRWTAWWPTIWTALRTRPAPPPASPPIPPSPLSGFAPPPAASNPASPPPRPKLVVNGKPTADHPWRRM